MRQSATRMRQDGRGSTRNRDARPHVWSMPQHRKEMGMRTASLIVNAAFGLGLALSSAFWILL